MAAPRERVALPDRLPDDGEFRAAWIGHESARWFPFDARLFLERAAQVGVAVTLSSSSGVYLGVGFAHCRAEWGWLQGWLTGHGPRAEQAVRKLLEADASVRAAHEALARLEAGA